MGIDMEEYYKPSTKKVLRGRMEIDAEELREWNEMLDKGDIDFSKKGWNELSTVLCRTVKFEDGCEADLKVNTDMYGTGDLYAECVLFDSEGHQLDFTEAAWSLDGEWRMETLDTDYIVEVVGK